MPLLVFVLLAIFCLVALGIACARQITRCKAKYLITRRQFDANQIAHTWDLEDGCGGA
jgi:hypothetical protein